MKAFDIALIDEKLLDEFRLMTDTLADDTVAEIISSGYEAQINQIFALLVQNDSVDPSVFSELEPDLAKTLIGYFEKTAHLPEWADADQLKIGEEVFAKFGPEIFMLLNVASLPMCYTCAHGAEVLYATGRLLSHNKDVDPLARRLMETAQMVVNVMSPGGLDPEGKGLVTIQKVRLIHASIRYFLHHPKNNRQWEVDRLGQPINQEDLAGTLMSFAPVILSGLKHLNVELSVEEQTAYMHCWKVVGYLMGIDERLLPDSYEQGHELAVKILAHQAAPSEAGRALTASCIQFINSMMPIATFDDVPAYMMDYFLTEYAAASGKPLSECIGIQNQGNMKDRLVLKLTQYLVGHIGEIAHWEMVRKISTPFNRLLLEGIIRYYNGGKKVHFFIPPSLKKNWKLEES
ncbi:oxygenase MpaB family protein [Reichenbachiella ulvae]|uniref:DUF2236 domain-containing protein n=1 Tax=Reichenbachiella ulvae TaxID=2980104 RepID=A0ABT3CSG1_9BACT|nr:oxygenase MpaB family protein [Reichenbachiella ulvae]MCV9386521.1 DUF2236 domain-containing protein [Reichenbachiella ulvae]